MFKIVIIVQAVSSGWSRVYDVNRSYQSFELCESARLEMLEVAEVYRQSLESQHLEPFTAVSKCVRKGDNA
jgi:hypothetical protein